MIKSFQCKKTQKMFETGRATGFLVPIKKQTKRKLAMLHLAASLEDLRVPPGNRLEVLRRRRAGQFSIRINDQYRICFKFYKGNADNVEIVDYHK